ncbi:cation:proton antiporter family protein [Geoalkalibacter halelectricus]|uniref:Cation:proton antiporter n=1 Tax=Geoalkalibacter halelectricus TaxID=2847045 RepID=A0ABY5ZI19_9BACT|nr:cation:proton antiporter family protein [Geoalkalibacter halelectricus]MDO3378976.1 cation:proton antiporter [Geoalkalibacter halelectricus]UWZ78792.1 cation:proton antiporter [Geoalkalibacter halelectricus]
MDPLWLTIAFLCGFLVRQVGLPPLVGFLLAGFILNALGVEGGMTLQVAADLGVILLLFTIGLKLKIQSLFKPEIWAGTSLHMVLTVAFFTAVFWGFTHLGLSLFTDLDLPALLLVGFALSFSSTVFAVKVLEEKGEMSSTHGSAAIGILIMQDVLAVVFLTVSTGKLPSPWAIAVLVGLFLVRPYLYRIMDRCDHGELTILFGFFLALVVGAASFEAVAMKADLGALIIGMLVANHPKAKELAKSLLGFKELFLVGFFLTIGLAEMPTWETLGLALVLTLLVPFKVILFFLLLCRFKLRARSSLLASFSLANYSEFGLIVGAVGVANGWLAADWLTVIAIALSLTFLLAAPLNSLGNGVYHRYQQLLLRYEARGRHPDDLIEPWPANIAIFGMGRIGLGAYNFMVERCGTSVIGVDVNEAIAEEHRNKGRNVILGDATDPDFWDLVKNRGGFGKLELVMLAMPKHRANLSAIEQLRKAGFTGTISAIAMYDDQIAELRDKGVHAAFNFYAEAGTGFAEHVYEEALRTGVLPSVCEVDQS